MPSETDGRSEDDERDARGQRQRDGDQPCEDEGRTRHHPNRLDDAEHALQEKKNPHFGKHPPRMVGTTGRDK